MKTFLLKDLQKAESYTLDVARRLPEEMYDFKPVEGVRSFRELIHHIAYSLEWMDTVYLQKEQIEWAPGPIPAGKTGLIAYLEKGFAGLASTVRKKQDWADEEISAFYFIMDHNAHHRGQAVTYTRCCGQEPPEYPF